MTDVEVAGVDVCILSSKWTEILVIDVKKLGPVTVRGHKNGWVEFVNDVYKTKDTNGEEAGAQEDDGDDEVDVWETGLKKPNLYTLIVFVGCQFSWLRSRVGAAVNLCLVNYTGQQPIFVVTDSFLVQHEPGEQPGHLQEEDAAQT